MNVLVVPMFALSRMGGPWSRAQAVAAAFERAGHHVVLGVSRDGNCLDPCVSDTVELPAPPPLGLPMAISSHTFPLAQKLGIAGRKPVRSFEEVLWLTGALSYAYERESVSAIVDTIADKRIDAIYSEYSLPAIIAACAVGVPVFGSFSYTTQASFASDPRKAGSLRKLLGELALPEVESSLDLFDWLDYRFVPSCRTLEPIDDSKTQFVGFLKKPVYVENAQCILDAPEVPNTRSAPGMPSVQCVPGTVIVPNMPSAQCVPGTKEAPNGHKAPRDGIVVYLGSGSIPQRAIKKAVVGAFVDADVDVYVAGVNGKHTEGNIHFAPRFDFSQLLPRARCFVHHGGQNSTMDALAHAVPQVIVPGRVFERRYNAQSIERAGAGIAIDRFTADALAEAVRRVGEGDAFKKAANSLRVELSRLGSVDAIVQRVESSCDCHLAYG